MKDIGIAVLSSEQLITKFPEVFKGIQKAGLKLSIENVTLEQKKLISLA